MLVFTTPQYIDELKFEYFETYSFNRGPLTTRLQEFLDLEAKEDNVVAWRELSLQRSNVGRQIKEKFPGHPAHIISDFNITLKINPTAVRTGIFDKNSPTALQLVSILLTDVKTTPAQKRPQPQYKDAIVFYSDKNKVVSYLDFSLDTEHICIDTTRNIDADETTYQKCREFFYKTLHHHSTLGLL